MIIENKNMSDTEVILGELDRIVSAELKKKDSERDDKLIDECIKEMAKLRNVRAGYNKEEIDAMFEEIQAKASGASKQTPARRKSVRRSVAAACAACLVLVCGVATVAWNPFSVIREWVLDVFESPTGTITEGQITYTNQDEIKRYDSIEELLKNENLDIYYPSVLPDNIYITRIESIIMPNASECINICFNSPDLQFTIQLETPIFLNTSEYETLQVNDITYYLSAQSNEYIAKTYINSTLYLIESSNYQDIILIINNLKKG